MGTTQVELRSRLKKTYTDAEKELIDNAILFQDGGKKKKYVIMHRGATEGTPLFRVYKHLIDMPEFEHHLGDISAIAAEILTKFALANGLKKELIC